MRFAIIMMCAALTCVQARAQAVTGAQGSGEARLDPAQIRLEIRNFESVLNNAVTATFSSSPFALVQKVKGVYLPGYGISFTFLINIHRAMVSTPFGEVKRGEAVTPEQKKRRIEELLNKLTVGLQENGGSFRQLRKDESVTIVAFHRGPQLSRTRRTRTRRCAQCVRSGSRRVRRTDESLAGIQTEDEDD